MFCPNCGTEDNTKTQFCRGCGAELQIVRTALSRPEAVTNAATTARQQIGQAIAFKITELRKASDLKKVVEEVLPQVEKFLESPEERRLRQLRNGVISTAIGIGVILGSVLLSATPDKYDAELLAFLGGCGGIVLLLIGLGIIVNARWLTVPRKSEDLLLIPKKVALDQRISNVSTTGEIPPEQEPGLASVTEGTTRQLR
jgi:hypothetical protein